MSEVLQGFGESEADVSESVSPTGYSHQLRDERGTHNGSTWNMKWQAGLAKLMSYMSHELSMS